MSRTPSTQRSLAIKAGLILLIAFILLIPLTMISGKISEREHFQSQAEDSIAKSWTAAQEVMAPILVIPYETQHAFTNAAAKTETVIQKEQIYVPLEQINITADVNTTLRQKGIYSAPVYTAALTMSGFIDTPNLNRIITALQEKAGFSRLLPAYLAIHINDSRGIGDTPMLTWQGENVPVIPGSGIATLSSGLRAQVSLPKEPTQTLKERLPLKVTFQLRGMSSLQFIPASLDTRINIHSNWPHPEFIGAFLPSEHTITNEGFSSQWRVNNFSSNIAQKLSTCQQKQCKQVKQLTLGANFYQAVDIYLQTDRALKYGLLFIAISFATFFLFEIIGRTPIHPIQYTFVGLALAIFYLLLISLSEHISFLKAYTLSTLGCLALLALYLGNVLKSYKASSGFCLALGALYAVLFVIIQLEDFALLTGAFMLFVLLGVLMLSTRKIDWYNIKGD